MTERERWVVYPLLFLALGAALRDKFRDSTTLKSIKCQELLVIDEQPLGKEVLLARIGGAPPTEDSPSNGQLLLNGEVLLNGQMDVIDTNVGNNSSSQLVQRLVTLGRAPMGPNKAIGGLVVVRGELAVDGVINAGQYAFRNVPMLPAMHGGVPAAAIPAELMRKLPQALAPNVPANPPGTAPPENSPQPSAPVEPNAEQPQTKGDSEASQPADDLSES